MVLHKWAVVSKAAPPPAGLRPLANIIPQHQRLKPDDYKIPYVMRTFIRDRHTSEVQHIENRGMFKEELSIERSRFPRFQKVLTVHTDGSLNEQEFEFTVPPLLVLFQDRAFAHRQRQLALAKINKLKKAHIWEETSEGEPSTNPTCNALVFPYCVPKQLIRRERVRDPLSVKKSSNDDRGN